MRRDINLYEQYHKILSEYLERKIIEIVPNLEKSFDNPAFYLIHHTVVRQDRV